MFDCFVSWERNIASNSLLSEPTTSMRKSVSVVIPAYNGQKYLQEAIESALSQTVAPFEIILVDDGSRDDTSRIAGKFEKHLRYIYQENKGAAGAYNTGIRNATGEFVAFLEQDDVWLPRKLEAQLEHLLRHETCGAVFCPVEFLYTEAPSKSYSLDYQAPAGEYGFADFFARNQILNCSSVMARAAVLTRAGSLREDMRLAFDYDLWLRISHEHSVCCLGEPLVKYRIHSDNISQDSNELMAATGNLQSLSFWLDDTRAITAVGKEKLRERIGAAYRRVAWDYNQLGNRKEELKHLWGAVKTQPLRIDNWRVYLWHHVKPPTRRRLAWYLKRVRHVL